MPVVTQVTLVTSEGADAKVTSAVAAQLGTGGSVPRRFTAASITAMQALSDAVKGDLCVRTDFAPNRVYQLVGVYSVSTDWVDITSPSSSLALGLTSTTAKPGDWVPAVAEVTGLSTALASKANTADVTTALADKISAADAPELIADAIGSSVIAGDGISTDYDDAAGTTTVAVAIPDWRARTVTAVTGAAPRIGLTVTVAYNDATSAWPSIDGGLLADPNVAIHWLGGPASATPPASAGPGVWYQQVS